jgi:predicted short-subunit dehydrogenase-like oxidoreductase (DUF2520 family)
MSHRTHPRQIAIVGRGRIGSALAEGLRGAGHQVVGPLGRKYHAEQIYGVEAVLLCVPDREIAAAAATLAQRLPQRRRCPLVGHCSGAGTLELLTDLPQGAGRFSLHPLMTFAAAQAPLWEGAAVAIAGSDPVALDFARALGEDLGMSPFVVEDRDRAAYHAAASIASNFLVTLEVAAERLALSAGCERELLVPLVRQTVRNWAARGPAALTGPIARGDLETVARQRDAVAERAPELLALFDALAQTTRELAEERTVA